MNRLLLAILAVSTLLGCDSHKDQTVDIWTAAATGNTATIQQHITSGSNLDAKDPAGGSSPLLVAALLGETETAKLLVDHGASLNSTNNDGSTALHGAAFFCHPETVAFLLEQGVDPEIRNGFGQPPLAWKKPSPKPMNPSPKNLSGCGPA